MLLRLHRSCDAYGGDEGLVDAHFDARNAARLVGKLHDPEIHEQVAATQAAIGQKYAMRGALAPTAPGLRWMPSSIRKQLEFTAAGSAQPSIERQQGLRHSDVGNR